MDFHYLKQLPATPPKDLKPQDVNYIASRVVELTFTAWDLQSLGEDLGCASQPYKWEPNRRKQLLAELDGYFAHLYGLTRDELRYVLDPKDVFGEDFPSETFRVLKEKEEREHGEYRKQRLVLAAYRGNSRS